MVLGGLVGAILLGAIYGYYMWYVQTVPVVAMMLKFFAPIAYVVGIGVIVGRTARIGKVASRAFVGWFAVAVGIVSVYTGWVFWLLAWSGHDYFAPLSDDWWFSAVAQVADEGINYTPKWYATGTKSYLLWSLEAFLIVFLGWVLAVQTVHARGRAFCEACKEWAEDVYLSPELEAIGDKVGFQAELEIDPLARLLAILRVEPERHGTFSRIRIQACRKCENFFTLDVQGIRRWRDDNEEKTAETPLVDNLLIDKPTHDAIARHFPNAGKPVD